MPGFSYVLALILSALSALVPLQWISYYAPPLLPARQATVLFGGDMMFDRSIRTTIDAQGGDFIFSCIDPVLQGSDLVVANLEGPITDNPSMSVGSRIGSSDNFVFTFPTSTAPLLAAHHIDMINIGNNHIYNFGADGVRSTVNALSSAGVQYFGDPLEQHVATTTINRITLAFINYDQFAEASTASTTIAQIRKARTVGELPIVYTHWGIEYATTSPAFVHTLAHEFVDAGAAIVIGSHPHVVEEEETYQGVPIFYSLGNFIFDQYWDDAVDHGLLLRVIFTTAGVQSVQEIPVELDHDRRTCPVTS